MSSLRDGRILDFDPATGITEKYYEIDGKWILERQQDVEDIAEFTKAQFNSIDERARYGKGNFHKVASIPNVIFMELERQGITKDPKRFKKWLNDRDNRVFRTRPGKV